MTKVAIDGSAHTGCYRCECECGEVWNGQGEANGIASWSPALALAECIVHHMEDHSPKRIDVDFSERFKKWLFLYWQQANARSALRAPAPPLAPRPRVPW